MYKVKYVIKDLTRLVYWKGYSAEDDSFTSRVLNAKRFDSIIEAERAIKIFSITTGGCRMSDSALIIEKVYFTNVP